MSFPRYPRYKPSGVEWLGEVPEHWGMAKLKYAAHLISGGTPNKEVTEYWNGSVPWASAKDLKTEAIADTVDHITERAVADGAHMVEVGDLLVVVRGMILAHSFPVTRALVPMAINQDLKAIRPRSEWHGEYFAYLLRAATPETFRRLDEAGHGTKALRMEAWGGMELPFPARQEQAAIASLLDKETEKIDALVAEQERLIELLKEKRQAVISHAVTKGLNPDAPMKDSGISWIATVPAHWEVVRLKWCISRLEQGWSPQCDGEPAGENEWGVLKVGCVNASEFNAAEQKALPAGVQPVPNLEITPGDILMSRGNTLELVGMAGLVGDVRRRLLLSDLLYRLRALPERADPVFLVAMLRSPIVRFQIEREATGTSASMKKVSQAMIRNFVILLPTLREQREIARKIEDALKSLDGLVAEAERAIALLQERRAALISAAVTGQIDVRAARSAEAA